MRKITDYMTIEATAGSDLNEQVLNAMDEDWQPHGGVAVAMVMDVRDERFIPYFLYAQAMVRYAEPAESEAA